MSSMREIRFRFHGTALATALWLFGAAATCLGQNTSASRPATQIRPGQKLLTVEAIWGPEGRVDFGGSYATGMTWLDDGKHFLHRREEVLQRVDALTDEASPAYDHEALLAALEAHEDFEEAAAVACVA